MIRLGMVVLTLLNFPTPLAGAQSAIVTDLVSLKLEQLTDVQFRTASKHEQDASETPAWASNVTRAMIRHPQPCRKRAGRRKTSHSTFRLHAESFATGDLR